MFNMMKTLNFVLLIVSQSKQNADKCTLKNVKRTHAHHAQSAPNKTGGIVHPDCFMNDYIGTQIKFRSKASTLSQYLSHFGLHRLAFLNEIN